MPFLPPNEQRQSTEGTSAVGSSDSILRRLVCVRAGITGKIVMDFKADRIMDYAVYALPAGARKFVRVVDIPMISVSTNGTSCSSWIVRTFGLSRV